MDAYTPIYMKCEISAPNVLKTFETH